MSVLPDDNQARRYAEAIGGHRGPAIPAAELLKIYELFGGLDSFKELNLSHGWRYLRRELTGAVNFPVEKYRELVNSITKFSRDDVKDFASSPHSVGDWVTFERLWSSFKDSFIWGLSHAETFALVRHPKWANSFSEELPMVHHDNCLAGQGQNHYWCYKPVITHGDKLREFYKEFKAEYEARFDPDVLATIRGEVLSLTERSRETYAKSVLVSDIHWETLLTGKRPILNAVSQNRLLPEEFAYEIIKAHKTGSLRIDIARNAGSKELLEYIWAGTTSKDIRSAVAGNALAERYETHAELLSPWG